MIIISNHYNRLDSKLKYIESSQNITRPAKDSAYYKDLKSSRDYHTSRSLKSQIATVARERWFFLQLKAKYAGKIIVNDVCVYVISFAIIIDGQYIASRLSKLISKSSAQLKSLLSQYNSLGFGSIKWEEATDLGSSIWYEGILQSHVQVHKSFSFNF